MMPEHPVQKHSPPNLSVSIFLPFRCVGSNVLILDISMSEKGIYLFGLRKSTYTNTKSDVYPTVIYKQRGDFNIQKETTNLATRLTNEKPPEVYNCVSAAAFAFSCSSNSLSRASLSLSSLSRSSSNRLSSSSFICASHFSSFSASS